MIQLLNIENIQGKKTYKLYEQGSRLVSLLFIDSIHPSIQANDGCLWIMSVMYTYLSLLGDLSCNSGHIVYRLKRREIQLCQFDCCFWLLLLPRLALNIVKIQTSPMPHAPSLSPDKFKLPIFICHFRLPQRSSLLAGWIKIAHHYLLCIRRKGSSFRKYQIYSVSRSNWIRKIQSALRLLSLSHGCIMIAPGIDQHLNFFWLESLSSLFISSALILEINCI